MWFKLIDAITDGENAGSLQVKASSRKEGGIYGKVLQIKVVKTALTR